MLNLFAKLHIPESTTFITAYYTNAGLGAVARLKGQIFTAFSTNGMRARTCVHVAIDFIIRARCHYVIRRFAGNGYVKIGFMLPCARGRLHVSHD